MHRTGKNKLRAISAKWTKQGIVLTLLLLSCNYSRAFNAKQRLDSLLQIVKKDKEDTIKATHLIAIANCYFRLGDGKLLKQTADSLETLSGKINYPQGTANAYIGYGNAFLLSGETDKALDYQRKALKLYQDIGDKKGKVIALGNIGSLYGQTSNYSKAFEYFSEALQTAKESGNKEGEAINNNNIGVIYAKQGDYTNALDFFLRSLEIDHETGNKVNEARATGNVGIIYTNLGNNKKALETFLEAEKLNEELGDKPEITRDEGNIGSAYNRMGDHQKALEYMEKALRNAEDMNDRYSEITNLTNIGNILEELGNEKDTGYVAYYYKALVIAREGNYKELEEQILASIGRSYVLRKDYKKALAVLTDVLNKGIAIGDMESVRMIYGYLSDTYKGLNDWENAYKMSLKSSTIKDSIFNNQKNKELGRLDARADFEKQRVLQKTEEEKQAALEAAESKRQKLFILLITAVALAVIIIAIAVFRSLKTTRSQQKLIEMQKMADEQQTILVEEKNKEITDSINYAKRLQDAILPPTDEINKLLPDSFVLYKPKDIVAGDFYWMGKAFTNPSEGGANITEPSFGGQLGRTILIAAADCTGHGVPGAMVSVVCSTALDRAVKEFGLTDTAKILDKARELVTETFEKSESEVKDGMDISLASLTPTKAGIKLQWSGANIPLWYTMGGALAEVAPDKQPVGKQGNSSAFSEHEIELQKGNTFYLFSDGFTQQIGGPKAEKFGFDQLRKKLVSIAGQGMQQQKKELEELFLTWKGNSLQTDDVLIIGVRI